MDSEQHPFQAGVEVALVTRNNGDTRFTLGRVEKVHKTGRFVIVGSSQQYRAGKDTYSKMWQGRQSGGSSFYGRTYVELVTDELRQEAANTLRRARFLDTVFTFDKYRRKYAERVTDAQLADLLRILTELQVEPEEGADQ